VCDNFFFFCLHKMDVAHVCADKYQCAYIFFIIPPTNTLSLVFDTHTHTHAHAHSHTHTQTQTDRLKLAKQLGAIPLDGSDKFKKKRQKIIRKLVPNG